jgi:serine/threonine protein kinase
MVLDYLSSTLPRSAQGYPGAKNIHIDFLTSEGKIHSIPTQAHLNSDRSLAFVRRLTELWFGRKIIPIKLNEESSTHYIKIDELRKFASLDQVEELRKGHFESFLHEQGELRARKEKCLKKIKALANKKDVSFASHQDHLIKLFNEKGFKAVGEAKKYIEDIADKNQKEIKAKRGAEARFRGILYGLPIKIETDFQNQYFSKPLGGKTVTPFIAQNNKPHLNAEKLFDLSKKLGFHKREERHLQKLGHTVSFASLHKVLEGTKSVEGKRIMVRTFIAIGKELKGKFSLFNNEKPRYFKRIKQGDRRMTHAFAIKNNVIFVVPKKALVGKGSFKEVSAATKLNDLSTPYVRVKPQAEGGDLEGTIRAITEVEREEKFLGKLHKHGKATKKEGHSCLVPPYECVVISKSEDAPKCVMFQQQLNDGKKLLEPAPILQKLYVLRDVANGLAYLHLLKFAHMDVKPANILMLGYQGRVADFGLKARIGTLLKGGSIAFLPGEAIQRVPAPVYATFKLDCKATPEIDSFSLGVTIFNVVIARSLPKILGLLEQKDIDFIIKIEKQRVEQSSDSKKDKELKIKMLNIAHRLLQQKPENRISCQSAAEQLNQLIATSGKSQTTATK